jgi:tetratricopeptide (TPR) repeat protein
MPESRLWAVHSLAFLPMPLSLILLTAALVFLTPLGTKVSAWISSREYRQVSPWQFALIAFALFLTFCVKGELLGDGVLCTSRLSHVGEMQNLGYKIAPGRFISQKEPGELMAHEAAFLVVSSLFGPERVPARGEAAQKEHNERLDKFRDLAAMSYRVLSALAGALAVLILIRFARASKLVRSRTIFWLALLTGGVWLIFFGYVENYSWVSLFMLLSLTSGVRAADEGKHFPTASLLWFVLAVLFHFAAIVLLPAMLYLLWTLHAKQSGRRLIPLWQWLVGFSILGLAGYVWVRGWKGWISVIPLLPKWTKDGYAFLTWKHFADIGNLLVWSAILSLPLLFVRQRDEVSASLALRYLLIASLCGALFALVFSPNLGMARDWDIVSAALWPLLLFAAVKLSSIEFSQAQSHAAGGALLAMVLIVLTPAVLVQANEQSAVSRFRDLLSLDRSRSAYGWENLASYYQRKENLEERILAWREAVTVERNPRYLVNLATALKLADRIDEADTVAIAAAAKNREFTSQLFYFSAMQAKRGRLDRSRALVDTAVALNPEIRLGKEMKLWAAQAYEVDSIAKSGNLAQAKERGLFYMRQDSTNSYWPDYLAKLK